ncbi:MAG: pyridoxamine 5'-phosphate oxidase family protein [Aggregatilineales bacterium]
MAKVYEVITEELQAFIAQQHIFFVATAPLSSDGHVNLSPKGMDSFRVLSGHQVAYLDLTGSGNETSAHIQENGRITFMFCAFEGSPSVLRLYGHGRVVLPNDSEWQALSNHFMLYPGTRQIITADITRVSTACGYAVPLYAFEGQREALVKWAEHKGDDGIKTYWQEKNLRSIDSLPTPLLEV